MIRKEGFEVIKKADDPFMQAAIDEAREGIRKKHGGPFGAVIVKDGRIVGRGHNRVLASHDPTCHGEIAAIRDASANLGIHDLTGCVLYTTGEPCPMCFFACMWANISRICYGCTIADNARIGFRDEKFDSLVRKTDLSGEFLVCLDREACLALFEEYRSMDHSLY